MAVNFEALSFLGFPHGQRMKEDGWEVGSRGRVVLGAAGCSVRLHLAVGSSGPIELLLLLCFALHEMNSGLVLQHAFIPDPFSIPV